MVADDVNNISRMVIRHFLWFAFSTILFAGMRESRRCRTRTDAWFRNVDTRPRVFALRPAPHPILAS